MYIYKTTCLVNGKIYIGQSCKPPELNTKYLGSGEALSNAIKLYGRDKFQKEVLRKDILTQALLNKWEQIYIIRFDATNRDIGYNILYGGQGASTSSPVLIESVRLKMKATKTGKNTGKDNPNFGRKWTDEQKLEQGKRLKGRTAWNKGLTFRVKESTEQRNERLRNQANNRKDRSFKVKQ